MDERGYGSSQGVSVASLVNSGRSAYGLAPQAVERDMTRMLASSPSASTWRLATSGCFGDRTNWPKRRCSADSRAMKQWLSSMLRRRTCALSSRS
jgi:hypothetical protein